MPFSQPARHRIQPRKPCLLASRCIPKPVHDFRQQIVQHPNFRRSDRVDRIQRFPCVLQKGVAPILCIRDCPFHADREDSALPRLMHEIDIRFRIRCRRGIRYNVRQIRRSANLRQDPPTLKFGCQRHKIDR
ncbi:hypothetical protein SDC9_66353 [bioreactor metagenome]|uniref:Uncharacterized protein n=1 Tax=bioreactor metagenome TaxID=1076179 RepID=A0A644XUP1_9ZZZZ